eukprot:621249_1
MTFITRRPLYSMCLAIVLLAMIPNAEGQISNALLDGTTSIVASSVFSDISCQPMDVKYSRTDQCWCSASSTCDTGVYIEVTFPQIHKITKVGLKECSFSTFNEYITSYKIEYYYLDSWKWYNNGETLTGNSDACRYTCESTTDLTTIIATKIRMYPLTAESWCSTQMELYGYPWTPTVAPTSNPTHPTPTPTTAPSDSPTVAPTSNPTHPTPTPTTAPSDSPTVAPTSNPTHPTPTPTTAPSDSPSAAPSTSPSITSASPTSAPSIAPSITPTIVPSTAPTRAPSLAPSTPPTHAPSGHSDAPSLAPTTSPTVAPSDAPSLVPSFAPSTSPTYTTSVPSNIPTRYPTVTPSLTPSDVPSLAPSIAPSQPPTAAPSNVPSGSPSQPPTTAPTDAPSTPSDTPTDAPSNAPSVLPTSEPINAPSNAPSVAPTKATASPSTSPSLAPSSAPSSPPTVAPSDSPSSAPSWIPTDDPTVDPSGDPTKDPTHDPTGVPSVFPTKTPTLTPTNPTTLPTTSPTNDPTKGPTKYTTKYPTDQPTFKSNDVHLICFYNDDEMKEYMKRMTLLQYAQVMTTALLSSVEAITHYDEGEISSCVFCNVFSFALDDECPNYDEDSMGDRKHTKSEYIAVAVLSIVSDTDIDEYRDYLMSTLTSQALKDEFTENVNIGLDAIHSRRRYLLGSRQQQMFQVIDIKVMDSWSYIQSTQQTQKDSEQIQNSDPANTTLIVVGIFVAVVGAIVFVYCHQNRRKEQANEREEGVLFDEKANENDGGKESDINNDEAIVDKLNETHLNQHKADVEDNDRDIMKVINETNERDSMDDYGEDMDFEFEI